MTADEETSQVLADAESEDLDDLDDAELDDVEFVLEEVESKIAPLALATA